MATAVRGSLRQTTGWTTPEANEVWESLGEGGSRHGVPGEKLAEAPERRIPSVKKTDECLEGNRRTFCVPGAMQTVAANVQLGVPWYAVVLREAELFMISWHKNEEAVSRLGSAERDRKGHSTTTTPPTTKYSLGPSLRIHHNIYQCSASKLIKRAIPVHPTGPVTG